jgi:hypothetical protein
VDHADFDAAIAVATRSWPQMRGRSGTAGSDSPGAAITVAAYSDAYA